MGKRFFSYAVCMLLCLCASGCGVNGDSKNGATLSSEAVSSSATSPEGPSSVPSPSPKPAPDYFDEAEKEKVKAVLEDVIPRYREYQRIWLSNVEYDPEQYIEVSEGDLNLRYYPVTEDLTNEKIARMIETLFTKRYQPDRFFQYYERDGKLYISDGGIGLAYSYQTEGFRLLWYEGDNAFLAALPPDSRDSAASFTLFACQKEDGVWKIDRVYHPVYGIQ